MEQDWDVVVLGTGVAGLTAAFTAAKLGLSVGLYEKSEYVGGTSAWSGGNVWVPCNPHQSSLGITDSRGDAFTYIMSLSRGVLDEDLVNTYLDTAPGVIEFLDENAGMEFYVIPEWPDYHPEHPGGKPDGGRTLECPVFSYEPLGAWAGRVRRNPYKHPKPRLAMIETPLGAVDPIPPAKAELARRERHDERGCGEALVGRLLSACLDVGVEPRTSCRAQELIVEDGAVAGVRITSDGGELLARGRFGVVLSTGGFEWNEELKRAFLRGPLTHPLSVQSNTGDGLSMAMKAGAMLANMREAWWSPATELPPGVNPMNRDMVNSERSRPRSMIVNRDGRRFANEAVNYNAFGGALHQEDVTAFDYANLPCWLIFDHEYLRQYGTVGAVAPTDVPPSWLTGYETLAALAADLGIDADGLRATVEHWNQNVADGHDPGFHRGEGAHGRWWGDKASHRDAFSTLGPVDTPPYYAVEIHSGALGTKGGPKVDSDARVLDVDGNPITGLYAAGNVMGSVFGATYGGAGGTLGPAMVFGHIAGKHAASRASTTQQKT